VNSPPVFQQCESANLCFQAPSETLKSTKPDLYLDMSGVSRLGEWTRRREAAGACIRRAGEGN